MVLNISPLLILVLTTTFLAMARTHEFKETYMSLYFQDFTAGPNLTTLPLAGIACKLWTFDQFGTVYVNDDPITEGPCPESALVGRAQAFVVTSALNGRNALVFLSIVFTNKKYNGSTIEIQGNSKQFEPVREVAVVSGTGEFRFARGYATLETYFVDQPRGYSVIRCNITVQHH
ncbi:pterocarpan synthase 1-like [Argentina anserina]|uniref:pterocarpan synthase 1-like n=1 Tax=Argentina anserina TaxID=57926 RepID=UPI0021763DE1|nr:pterocarpan synthase 1-like [Potentilla anserina]